MKGWGGKHPDRMCMVKEEDPGAGSSSVGGPGGPACPLDRAKTAEVQGVVLADGPQCCPMLLWSSLGSVPGCSLAVFSGWPVGLSRGRGFYLVKPATLSLQLPDS